MAQSLSSMAKEGVELNDVIKGIVRLPLPIQERISLLRKLYDATAEVKEGKAVLQGPFREELFALFTNRYKEVRAERANLQKARLKAGEKLKVLADQPVEAWQEEELNRIVDETREDFSKLERDLQKFGANLEKEVEADVQGGADALGIAEARKQLAQSPDATKNQKNVGTKLEKPQVKDERADTPNFQQSA